ncbi:hypothetical protein D3C80_1083060 [compost metagenome]
MGLQPLQQVGIVFQATQAEEGLVQRIGAVTRLGPQLQPGRLGQAMVAQPVERVAGLGGVVQKTVLLDPARSAGPAWPAVFKRAGRLHVLAQRKQHNGHQRPVQRPRHQNFPLLVFIKLDNSVNDYFC